VNVVFGEFVNETMVGLRDLILEFRSRQYGPKLETTILIVWW